MNNAKMWLVVNPTVGFPLILGAVAVGSFAVHLAVVSNTSWVSDFISGQPMGTGDAMEASARMTLPEADVSNASFTLPTTNGGLEVQIKMPDGTTTNGILKLPEVHASAGATPLLEVTQ